MKCGALSESKYFLALRGRVFRPCDFGKQDDEFIAALAADGVGTAHAGQQAFRNGLKKQVADGMSQRIVDVLEMIQIEKNHGDRTVLAASQGNRLGDPVVEQQRDWANS